MFICIAPIDFEVKDKYFNSIICILSPADIDVDFLEVDCDNLEQLGVLFTRITWLKFIGNLT